MKYLLLIPVLFLSGCASLSTKLIESTSKDLAKGFDKYCEEATEADRMKMREDVNRQLKVAKSVKVEC